MSRLNVENNVKPLMRKVSAVYEKTPKGEVLSLRNPATNEWQLIAGKEVQTILITGTLRQVYDFLLGMEHILFM